MKRAIALASGLALAGCNSNSMGLDLVTVPGTPWVAYAVTFVAGAIVCPLIIAVLGYAAITRDLS